MDINTKIKKDLQSFSDSEEDVIVQNNGQILFTRSGVVNEIKAIVNAETNQIYIDFDGKRLAYNDYISKEIAQLDIFAQKLLDKRRNIEPFIEGPGNLSTPWNNQHGNSLILLQEECEEVLLSGSKVTFITADAGHGKTALLKEFQIVQANRFLNGESSFLFWHVDLQGRDLVRLAEAIMYDLGELRIRGLYFSSIITLIKNRNIILAIDGFDELAAEIGGESALGSLSSLVKQMNGRGTLIAASRRTFFDTQDYLKRTNYLSSQISSSCSFNELKILDWTENEVIEYISYYSDNPKELYQKIIDHFNNKQHPILTRPFLLSKLIGLIDFQDEFNSINAILDEMNGSSDGVSTIVRSFIKREVQKWKERDKVTGKPYLTFEQHLQLLAVFAREMWESQSDVISLDEIELYGAMLCDEWEISASNKPIVMRLLQSHGLLIPVKGHSGDYRQFDHLEFKNFFLGKSLGFNLAELNLQRIKKFLHLGQVPDSVPRYMLSELDSSKIKEYLQLFTSIIEKEWKPTHVQSNVGTIVPFLLNEHKGSEILKFNGKVTYSSLVFENKCLSNISISNGTFINVSLKNVSLENVEFDNCHFTEIVFDVLSKNSFDHVIISNSRIDSIQILSGLDLIETAYSPERIQELLYSRNIKNSADEFIPEDKEKSEFSVLVNKFLSKYHRTIFQYEKNLENQNVFGSTTKKVLEHVIPFLLEKDIISLVDNKSIKQRGGDAYRLNHDLKDILAANSEFDNSDLGKFWKAVYDYQL